MIPVLVVLVLLAASGFLARRSVLRAEQATEAIRSLDPCAWRGVTAEITDVTDGLRWAVAERIDR